MTYDIQRLQKDRQFAPEMKKLKNLFIILHD